MASGIWNWAAVLLGLEPGGGEFIPLYWALPSRLVASFDFVPDPRIILWTVLLLSFAAVGAFIRTRKWVWMDVACLLWGALFADTPFVAVLPAAAWIAWTLLTRFAWRTMCKRGYDVCTTSPRSRICFIFAVGFLAVAAVNFIRFKLDYPTLYLRHAAAMAHLDGGWHPIDQARMDAILRDYVAELAREGAGCRWIFTDGLCDSGIELAAQGCLRTLSLAGKPHNESDWRERGFTGAEDLAALEGGTCRLLRSWAIDRPDNLSNAVYQCAFAFLEREAPGKTSRCGLTARSETPAVDEVARSRAAVDALARRIVEFYDRGGDPHHGGWLRRARFSSMQWRVARAIRHRAQQLDRAQRTEEALAATAVSEKLDSLNPFAKRLNSETGTADLRVFGSITPREGLAFALKRANFALARQYAQPILKDDPKNAEANFALAMGHLAAKEYAQARHYLEAALVTRPKDAALLNNLAVTLLELGETAAAKAKAEAALELKPDSPAIRSTLRQIDRKLGGKTEN